MLDFGLLAPEVNSALMYAGAGSGPLLAVAAAWDGLAIELHSVATSYFSVVSGLTGSWLGPASASMAAAAAPYVAWMHTTATQAEQAATQAQAAASAYEAAFAMTVPPPVIAANRSLLMTLIATNILGQNTPAIAATQAHYVEMWAQDAAAMYGYVGNSAAATTLTPFTPPPRTTSPAGLAGQAAIVAQATGTSAATNTQAALSQAMSAVPSTLHGLASPLSSTSSTSGLSGILQSLGLSSPLSYLSLLAPYTAAVTTTGMALSAHMASTQGTTGTTATGTGPQTLVSTGGLSSQAGGGPWSAGSAGLGAGAGGPGVSAGMGRAATIGALSVPQSWAAATPAEVTGPGAAALPGTSAGAAPAGATTGPGGPYGGMPLAAMGERGAGSAEPGARYEFRPTVVPRTPAAG